ncbi:MAG: glutathione S-transferase family protein [Myxococcota bacterium]|nr:glutathione S-transferase family protein [Myxococcota bacterium]
MKLFDNPLSPYAMKIRMILYEKGLDFEKHEVHSHADAAELARLNPRAEVPALVDGETVVCDSKVIAEYLEETHPEPALLPKTPEGRAQCRALELVADTELDAAVLAWSLFKFFRPAMAEQLPEVMQRAENSVRAHYAALDRALEGRPFFVGEFSRADLAFAPHVGACAFMGLAPGEDTPHLAAWHARMTERESVQRVSQESIASIGQQHDDPFFDPERLHWRSDRIEQLLRIGLGSWLLEELAADRAFLPPEP